MIKTCTKGTLGHFKYISVLNNMPDSSIYSTVYNGDLYRPSTNTGGGKIIGPPLVNAKKLTFYFKKRSVRLANIFDRNIGIW